ncbi:Protein rdm16 [Asimina triloba]
MDRVSEKEKEKSARKSRDDRDRDSPKRHHRDRDHHRTARDGRSRDVEDDHRSDDRRRRARDTEENYRSSRDGKTRDAEDDRRHQSHHRHGSREKHRHERSPSEEDDSSKGKSHKQRDWERQRLKDRAQDLDKGDRLNGREGSGDRGYREESPERRPPSSSHKRKGHDDELSDRADKRARVSEERKERRRFEDKPSVEDTGSRDVNGNSKRIRGEERELEELEIEFAKEEKKSTIEEPSNVPWSSATSNGSSFVADAASLEPLNMVMPETSSVSIEPPATKVSSISTTNENKGVSVIGSHEVPGKSSTDGTTTSAAGKGGNLSLDALAKAKRVLQMKKELQEKLKKVPQVSACQAVQGQSREVGANNEGAKFPSSSFPASATFSKATLGPASPSTSTLPTAVAASTKPPPSAVPALAGITSIPSVEAVKRAQELAAKMGFRQDPEFAPLINLFPGHAIPDLSVPQKPAKAPVLRLDALGREIDEHGNVINKPKPTNLSTLKVNINKQKKEAFQILRPEFDADSESNPHFDERMGVNKTKLVRPKRMTFQFVEEGKWSKQAEIVKFKSQFGEAQAKELKTKQAQLAKAKAEPDINPNLIEVSERIVTKEKPKDPIPDVEWWDVSFLLSGNYSDVTEGSIDEDKLKMEKITIYVEHPLPIEPPAEPAPPPPQPLKLTRKEQKKLRTQRRLAKEKDRQEMIRQGLLEPPKPKVKMSNLMKVLGSEATQDPTKLEMEIRSAAAEREQAHVDRNIARKLTPAERREKKERKLFDEPNTFETVVSVYKMKHLSHPPTRFKVDVNATENRLTGCAVITDSMAAVVVEGGNKPIKRYRKLMLRRINWAAAVADGEDGAEMDEDAPVNKCVLVWQGCVAKPSFNRFLMHQCRTEAAARKVFSDAGVGHYWDLAVNYSDE